PGPPQAREGGHGGAEALELPAPVGARRESGLDRGALGRREGVVDESGERVARVSAGHGKNRSSLSLRSSRARWRRERTVPSSSPRTSAISSYARPSRSRRTTTIRRSSESSAMAR